MHNNGKTVHGKTFFELVFELARGLLYKPWLGVLEKSEAKKVCDLDILFEVYNQ